MTEPRFGLLERKAVLLMKNEKACAGDNFLGKEISEPHLS